MKKPTKPKLVIDSKSSFKQLDDKELNKVIGGSTYIPKRVDPSNDGR